MTGRQPFAEKLPTSYHNFERNAVLDVQRTVGSKDCSTSAIAALAITSAIIGASCKIEVKRGYQQPAHLYTAIVQRSGSAKSPTMEYFLAHPHKLQKEYYADYKSEKTAYRTALTEWKVRVKKDPNEVEPVPPTPKRIIVSDVTIEKLALMLEANPFGLLLYRDELDSFLGGLERYSNASDEPHYIAIHNGQPLFIDRKTSNDIHVPNPSLSIIGGIQPDILKQRLKENPNYFTSGFFVRWLLAMPPFEPVRDNDNVIDAVVSGAWENLIDRLLSNREQAFALDDNGEHKLEPFVFPLSADAKTIYRTHQHKHADEQKYANPTDGALHAKFATNALRIALTLHCAEIATYDNVGFAALKSVSAETMQSACDIAEWFTNEAIRVFRSFSNGDGDSRFTPGEQEVVKVLRKQGEPMTASEVKRKNRQTKKIEDIESVFLNLKKMGVVVERERTADAIGGRPTTEFSLA